MYTSVSAFSSGFVQPSFLKPNKNTALVEDLTAEEIWWGTKLNPVIQVDFETTFCEVQVLEVTVLQEGFSIVLGIPRNSESSTFDVNRATAWHQPNGNGTVALVYHFFHESMAIATDNSQYSELGATTLNNCSGTNRIKLCRNYFSNTTDEIFLCMRYLFYEYKIPAPLNCLVDSVFLLEALQGFHLAHGLHHGISGTAPIHVKNNTGAWLYPYASISARSDYSV